MKGKKMRRAPLWLNLYACLLIPAYTLLFAGATQWFSSNFSVIAVMGRDNYRGFVLWGLLAGGYFLAVLIQIGRTFRMRSVRRTMYLLTVSACACLGCAIMVPYLPDYLPRFARLHVMWAFSACVLLMLALLLALACAWRENHARYARLLLAWVGIAAGSGVLFAAAEMVSSALEVLFTSAAAQLARPLWIRRLGR